MSNITVIIPVIELDEAKNKLFEAALSSVDNSVEVIVVGSQAALDSITTKVRPFTPLVNTGNTVYAAQVNLAVESVNTKYFSVLEYDDLYTDIWFKNAEEYIEDDTIGVFGFLPLTEIIDANKAEVLGYANDAYWATSFSTDLGYLDLDSITDYFNFNVSGAVFKKDTFVSLGKLKPSMKLVFWYEFLMRALYKGEKLYVIPKVGYNHFVGREGTMLDTYSNNMSEKESGWWVELAKKEYFFPQDRNKTYKE